MEVDHDVHVTHTHTHRSDNIRFWNVALVKECVSALNTGVAKVDAKGHHHPSASEIAVGFVVKTQMLVCVICDNHRQPHQIDVTDDHRGVTAAAIRSASKVPLASVTLLSASPLRGCDLYRIAMAKRVRRTCNTSVTRM